MESIETNDRTLEERRQEAIIRNRWRKRQAKRH